MIEVESERLISSLFEINITIDKMKAEITENIHKSSYCNTISREEYTKIIWDSILMICKESKRINSFVYANVTPTKVTSDMSDNLEDKFNNEIISILSELKDNERKICDELIGIKLIEGLEFISTDLIKEFEINTTSIITALSTIADIMTATSKDPANNHCNIYMICKFRFIQILSFRVISELKIMNDDTAFIQKY